jgi:hypothetical protein
MEYNTRVEREFTQKHQRYTKKGTTKLTDPRDVYELVANHAARRLRACILNVLPSDIVEDAIAACEQTLKTQQTKPISDRIKDMLIAFNGMGVNQGMIEKRIGHKVDVINETELLNLGKIFHSIKDGMSKREDWFEFETVEPKGKEINKKLLEKPKEKAKTGIDKTQCAKLINDIYQAKRPAELQLLSEVIQEENEKFDKKQLDQLEKALDKRAGEIQE